MFQLDKIEIDITKYEIIFIKDPLRINISNVPDDSYLIYHDNYEYPIIDGVENISFNDFKKSYVDIHANLFIFVGINKMVTPSSRCDFVQEYLSTLTQNIQKISIDTSPFIGEPWRLFFHYLYTNNNKFRRPHSYAIQTEWNHWFYRESIDCLLSPENIKFFIVKTFSDLDVLNTSFEFEPITINDERWYQEVKEHIFNKYHTPKSLINGILNICNKKYNNNISYNTYLENKKIILPDFNIYRFMVEENLRRQGIYNAIIEVGRK
ncbi:MAG: hypothetical protein ACFFG0_07530 [Candidatus Thorarchaeota archaeon]